MSLADRIQAARHRLLDGSLGNEAVVSQVVVLSIIDALGWSTYDPHHVYPEYSVGTRRVDFALLTHGTPAVFVEVKQPGLASRADRQLFEYAFHEGVPLAVLTDGATWHFYIPGAQGSYDDRRVYLLDLLEREPEESAARLKRYLSRRAVESGDAFDHAQADYKQSKQRKGAAEAIPQAWANLVSEPRLADLLAAEVESVCGFQPEASDVAAFLAALKQGISTLPEPNTKRNRNSNHVEEPRPERLSRRVIPGSAGSWTGKSVTLPDGTELRGQHRGEEKVARIERGQIVHAGKRFNSPSAAGRAATGRSTNGWTFWEVKRPSDIGWLLLTTLRD